MNKATVILAVDTATEACSAALWVNGEISSEYKLAPREHSRLILRMIDDLLLEAGVSIDLLDAIAFGCGPGSFMGIRIAAGVVQGIAFAHDIPVIPVSTLKAIAHASYLQTDMQKILTAIDARMDEVYWAVYTHKGSDWVLSGEERVISPDQINLTDELSAADEDWVGAGTGWGSYAERLLAGCPRNPVQLLDVCFPSAEVIVQLAIGDYEAGRVVKASQAVPVYLRNNVAKKPKPVVL